MTTGHDAESGDFLDYWSGGGGGFGDPLDRDPALVLEDVKDDYVSTAAALREYGVVVLTPGLRYDDWSVDEAATQQERAARRA